MCGDSNILTAIYFLKMLIDVIRVAIPIILILLVAIDLAKVVMSSEGFDPKLIGKTTKRMVAAACVFFVPALVSFLFSLVGSNSDAGLTCYTNVTKDDIELAKAREKLEEDKKKKEIEEEKKKSDEERKRIELLREEIRKANEEEAKRKEEEAKKEQENNNNNNNNESNNSYDSSSYYDDSGELVVSVIPKSNSRKPFINGVQRALKKGDCMSKSDKCFCPTVGKSVGFQFTMESSTSRNFNWVSSSIKLTKVSVKCSDGTSITKDVSSTVASNFQKAFEKICQLKTTGINGVKINSKYLYIDGTYVKRLVSARTSCSQHAYATAIDINYNMKMTIGGRTYKPYDSMGTGTKAEYQAFVKALGRESDPRNVNYILWIYAFKPAGFQWGGNWSASQFDPMHFQM